MAYAAPLEELLLILREADHIKAEVISKNKRRIEHGLHSVGSKIHCVGDYSPFLPLIKRIGGRKQLEMNMYRHAKERTSMCMVLPPVGSARIAILLLECIESFVKWPLFGNKKVQIQVCSPVELSPRRSAMVAIAHYLTLRHLWKYEDEMFKMTASYDLWYHRGEFIVIRGAGGFERGFEWWMRSAVASMHRPSRVFDNIAWHAKPDLVVLKELPFTGGRSDLLAVQEKDVIYNINLLATLLGHAETAGYEGYWKKLGVQFELDMQRLLAEHQLLGLLDAPWVQSGKLIHRHARFLEALQELIAYAHESTGRTGESILTQTKALLNSYRAKVEAQSILLTTQGGRR